MHDHDPPTRTPDARSRVIRLPAPAAMSRPRVAAAQVIARRRTPALATWRAGAPPPATARAHGGPADLLHDHGDQDGLIVVHFHNRVHMPVSVLAQEAGFDIETAWQALAELVQCGFLTARPDGDGYDATTPGPGPRRRARERAAAS